MDHIQNSLNNIFNKYPFSITIPNYVIGDSDENDLHIIKNGKINEHDISILYGILNEQNSFIYYDLCIYLKNTLHMCPGKYLIEGYCDILRDIIKKID